MHPTIRVSGAEEEGKVYLTSGIQPPSEEGTILEQVRCHAQFQSYASGGSIFHAWLAESIPADQKTKMVRSMFTNYPLRYVSFTTVLTVCNDCGAKVAGKSTSCSKCDSKDVTIWSRPVGYFRPVLRKNISEDTKNADHQFWLNSRTEEFTRRKEIKNGTIAALMDDLATII